MMADTLTKSRCVRFITYTPNILNAMSYVVSVYFLCELRRSELKKKNPSKSHVWHLSYNYCLS